MDLHAELERVMADSAVADTAARTRSARFVDVGMRSDNGFVNADSQRLDISKCGVSRNQASKDRVAGRPVVQHGMNYA